MAKHKIEQYRIYPRHTERMSETQLRKTYTWLRGVLNKRAKRVAAKGFSDFEYGKTLPKLSTIAPQDLEAAVLDAARRARDVGTFAEGFGERVETRIQALHDAGYDFVDRTNFRDFVDFMRSHESEFAAGLYDSSLIAQVYNQAAKLGYSSKDVEKEFMTYVKDTKTAEEMVYASMTAEKGMTPKEIRNAAGRLR